MNLLILLLLAVLVVYGFVAAALTSWGENNRLYDIMVTALFMAVWPVSMPLGYVYGTIRLRLKWRKYRGGRYLRKTFDAAGIDAHLDRVAKYNAEHKREVQ